MSNLSKRQVYEYLLLNCHEQASPLFSVECWQDGPWTAVRVGAEYFIYNDSFFDSLLDNYTNYECTEVGFSKVCWPDKYDSNKGYEIALRKALSKIARQLVYGNRGG